MTNKRNRESPSTKTRTTSAQTNLASLSTSCTEGTSSPTLGTGRCSNNDKVRDHAILHANKALQRLTYAAVTGPCKSWEDSCALAFAKAPRKSTVSSDHRPPTSAASTTNQPGPPSLACEFRRAEPSPCRGDTKVVSTASWAPSTMTSMRPDLEQICQPPRAHLPPCIPVRQLAQAGTPWFPTTPALEHAARWWPYTWRRRPHRQVREDSGSGRKRRRHNHMRNVCGSSLVARLVGKAVSAAILRNCQCKWHLNSSSTPGTWSSSCGFPEKLLFYVGMIVSTVVKSCTTTAYRWLFPDSHPPLRIFCDLQLSDHQHFPLWAQLYQQVFCKKPLLISSSSRYHIFCLSGREHKCCAYPSPIPLLLAPPLVIHEKNWKCLDVHATGFSMTLEKLLSSFNFSEILQSVRQIMQQIALYFFVSFIFIFVYFCWFLQRVSP